MKRNGKAAKTLYNALGGMRTGLWLMLRKCFCELKSYNAGAKRKSAVKVNSGKYSLPVSAIVCTYNRPKKLLNAVNSLINQTMDDKDYEIIVVNNGSEFAIDTVQKLSGVRIISESRLGLSNARNAGARAAKGEYLVFIDDDAVAEPDMLENVKNAFVNHKRAGIIGGLIKLRQPTPDIVLNGHEDLWSQYTAPFKKYREVSRQYEFPFGANFSVRHSVLDAVGGFDERYGRNGGDFSGGEETALCFKMLNSGFRIGIEPKSVVRHDVDLSRFTKEHIRRTITAGILTAHMLYRDGYSKSNWDKPYAEERIRIAEKEIERLKSIGAGELEIYYKECERDGFSELVQRLECEK